MGMMCNSVHILRHVYVPWTTILGWIQLCKMWAICFLGNPDSESKEAAGNTGKHHQPDREFEPHPSGAGSIQYRGGCRYEGGEEISWVTDRRQGRRKSIREDSPELTQPNKYAKLHKVGDINQAVALLEQSYSSSCQGSNSSNEMGQGYRKG